MSFAPALEQIQANCQHPVVLMKQPQHGENFMEEFPTYRCRDCGKFLNASCFNDETAGREIVSEPDGPWKPTPRSV